MALPSDSCAPNCPLLFLFFFFNDTATTEIYTLSLHDALPISTQSSSGPIRSRARSTNPSAAARSARHTLRPDRKSTRLNSSHDQISYAVFCLKKKKTPNNPTLIDESTPRSSVAPEQHSTAAPC